MDRTVLPFEEVSQKIESIGQGTLDNLFNKEKRKQFDPKAFADKELSDEFLQQLPFGEHLCKSAQQETGVLSTRVHLLYVIAAATEVFRNGGRIPNPCRDFTLFQPGLMEATVRAGLNKDYLSKLCCCAALYHDIGRAIALERHPYEGYHIVHDLGAVEPLPGDPPPETQVFKNWISQSRSPGMSPSESATYFRFFSRLLRYHDMWGNITTGEASVVMFSCALELSESRAEGHIAFLGHLLLLNLADQFGTPGLLGRDGKPQGIPDSVRDHLLEHWTAVASAVRETRGDAESIRSELMKHAEREGETIERITALLHAAHIDYAKPEVEFALRTECGGKFSAFCKDFGVVRLAYALRFFRCVSDLSKKRKLTVDRQALLVIRTLKRIVDTYESLIRANKEQGRETGIEMSWLSRNTAVQSSIVWSLIGESPGVWGWIDDEVSAFPCG